jgi:hypothetical protein
MIETSDNKIAILAVIIAVAVFALVIVVGSLL